MKRVNALTIKSGPTQSGLKPPQNTTTPPNGSGVPVGGEVIPVYGLEILSFIIVSLLVFFILYKKGSILQRLLARLGF